MTSSRMLVSLSRHVCSRSMYRRWLGPFPSSQNRCPDAQSDAATDESLTRISFLSRARIPLGAMEFPIVGLPITRYSLYFLILFWRFEKHCIKSKRNTRLVHPRGCSPDQQSLHPSIEACFRISEQMNGLRPNTVDSSARRGHERAENFGRPVKTGL